MDAPTLGKRIADLRKEKGMTQRELAEILHITDGAVSKWERELNFPDLSLIEPLAVALDTNVITLLASFVMIESDLQHRRDIKSVYINKNDLPGQVVFVLQNRFNFGVGILYLVVDTYARGSLTGIYPFNCQTPLFRYAAKVSQRR